jgi:hypothetical protein
VLTYCTHVAIDRVPSAKQDKKTNVMHFDLSESLSIGRSVSEVTRMTRWSCLGELGQVMSNLTARYWLKTARVHVGVK